jgi:cytochrome c-type biogenesis protein CcsB
MPFMYLVFFDASLVMAGLTTAAYFLYTFNQYRAAQETRDAKRGGTKRSRVRVAAQPVLAMQGTSPLDRFVRLMAGYRANMAEQIGSIRRGSTATATAVRTFEADRDFEVADATLPVSLQSQAIGRLSTILMYITAFCLAMALMFRTFITSHAPWTNLYEASVALAGFITVSYLIFEIRYKTRALGVLAAGISFLFLVFAVWVGAAFNQAEPVAFRQIMPALQDNPILTVHVSMMIISYAFFVLAFTCGIMMLVQGDGAKPRYSWLPTFEGADELGYRAVTIGFPLLALGIILGAYWANYAWGHYWSWDPKETSALVTWLIYAIYLHSRGLRGLRGRTMAWLLILGFAATLFTYFGVSFIIPGLHSYGGVK